MNESSATATRMYAPPESLVDRPHTQQGDVYALGVMLYQLAIGDLQRPLAAGWERDVDDEVVREDIAACVEGDARRRLATADELVQRLRKQERRRKEKTARAHAEQRKRRGGRRRIAAVLVAATAIALVAVGLALYYGFRKPETLLNKNVAYGLRCGTTEHWKGITPREVPVLDDPDLDDFLIQLDSKLFDLSSWHRAAPQDPEFAYLTRVLELVRKPGRSNNRVVRLQFRTEGDRNLPRIREVAIDSRSVMEQVTVHALHAAGKPMKDGRRVSLYELGMDVSRLPEGKTIRVIADSIFVNGFQTDPEWAGSRLDTGTQRAQLAIKLPDSKSFSGYALYEYPVNQKDAKTVSHVGEFWPDPAGGAFAWTIHAPKKGYVYEINWTWAEK